MLAIASSLFPGVGAACPVLAEMGRPAPTVSHLQQLRRKISDSTDERAKMEAIAEVIHIGFDDRNSSEIHEAAAPMLYPGPDFGLGLISRFQMWNVDISSRVLRPLVHMMQSDLPRLTETAEESLEQLRRNIETEQSYLFSETVMRAVLSAYAAASFTQTDLRPQIDQILYDHYSPLTIIPANMTVDEQGLMIFWDRFEHLSLFEAIASPNLNRQLFALPRIDNLAKAERLSGSQSTTVQEVLQAIDHPEKLKELELIICPEKHITDSAITRTIEFLCGAAIARMKPDIRGPFVQDLVEAVRNKVDDMPLLELSYMFFNEGGVSLNHGAPLKLVIQAALKRIDQLIADKDLELEKAGDTIDGLKQIVSIISNYLVQNRHVSSGYLDFDNPYAFTDFSTKGSA